MEVAATLTLPAGLHSLLIHYGEALGDNELLEYNGPDTNGRQVVPGSVLCTALQPGGRPRPWPVALIRTPNSQKLLDSWLKVRAESTGFFSTFGKPPASLLMHPNHELLHRFYQAFQRRDYAAMAACYHPNATFEDPAFQLRGAEIGAMWRMLIERGKDLSLTYNHIWADDTQGLAVWDARYTFSQTKRPVHNHVPARFTFQDGKILTHHDEFSFWRWSRQALGPIGWLLGWSPFLQAKVRASARQGLNAFMAHRGISV